MGKIEMLPIFQISPRPFQMIADMYDFKFSLVGKIWDGWETVKSQTVWDFPDIWKTGFTVSTLRAIKFITCKRYKQQN